MYRRPGWSYFWIRARSQSICCTDMLTPSDGVSGGYGVPAVPVWVISRLRSQLVAATTAVV
ncbi:hypothetical protein ACLB1E_04725 [Escherichia coli]